MNTTSLDELYHDLLNAQLDKNWGKVAKIQLDIYRHPEYREETESSMEQDSSDVRTDEDSV